MINNRQAGRRRGRNNNPRQQGGGNRGNGDSGNRIDNRARGNATQLLEKYRNMARDAQLAGDRVNAEYYLQFADHYFRVLADNRSRQEEQQQRFQRNDDNSAGDNFDGGDESYEGTDGDDENGGSEADAGNGSGGRDYQQPRRNEGRGEGREGRSEGRNDEGRERNRDRDQNRERNQDRGQDRDQPRRNERGDRRPRIANDDSDEANDGTISLAVLPPAIGRSEEPVSEAPAEAGEAVAKPRRGRRPRASEAAE